jgi:hypothetical protein
MSRLTLLHINIIGIVTTLLVALILFFVLVKPKQDEVANTNSQTSAAIAAHGTTADVEKHKKDLTQAKADAVKTDALWKVQSVYYMPNLPFDNKSDVLKSYFFPQVGKGQYGFRDLPTVYGRWITAWYDAQRNSGVSRVPGTEFPIDSFPADPNAIAKIDHLTFPADGKPWTVTVQCKNFDDGMAHLRKFNTMQHHGMPVINNVSVTGQSPELLLTYQLALYIIPATAPPAAEPFLGTGQAATTGGYPGMMGGMGGPGGPGMMGGMGGPGGPGMMGGPAMMSGRPGMGAPPGAASGGAPKGGGGSAE